MRDGHYTMKEDTCKTFYDSHEVAVRVGSVGVCMNLGDFDYHSSLRELNVNILCSMDIWF